MARASGLVLAGGADGNDPMAATTTGVGELIDRALDGGATRIIVGLGGSATTDGGLGALRAIHAPARLRRVELLVACDVTTMFVDAAAGVRAPEGRHAGAGRAVDAPPRTARIRCTATSTGSTSRRSRGAGRQAGWPARWRRSAAGSYPGSSWWPTRSTSPIGSPAPTSSSPARDTSTSRASRARWSAASPPTHRQADAPIHAIVGDADDDARQRIPTTTLVERFGLERAEREPLWCIEQVARAVLDRPVAGRPSGRRLSDDADRARSGRRGRLRGARYRR